MEEEEHGEYSGTSQQDTCLEWWYGWREKDLVLEKDIFNLKKILYRLCMEKQNCFVLKPDSKKFITKFDLSLGFLLMLYIMFLLEA